MVLKATVSFIVFAVFFSILIGCVESSEVRLISPIGAVSRSIIPGWGQVYTRSTLKGVIVFLSVGILGGAGVRADSIYRDYYNNKYRPAVLADSSQADSYFDRSNQYYKLSRFLLYSAAGIWAYGAIDAYVDAHIYNVRQQSKALDIDDGKLQQLKTGAEPNAERHHEDSDLFLPTDVLSRTEADFLLWWKMDSGFASTLYSFQRHKDTTRGD